MKSLPKIDTLIRSHRKSFALEITEDARLIVRAPRIAGRSAIERLILEKFDWISRKQREAQERLLAKQPRQFRNGEHFFYLGEKIPLRIEYASNRTLALRDEFHLSGKALADPASAFEAWYRNAARLYMTARTAFYAENEGLSGYTIRISGAKKRWGSCSSNRVLSFSWRLVMAPPEIIDYVIVHELAHLVHMNHSRNFWGLVAEMYPDFRSAKTWLKTNGHTLRI